MDVVPVVAVRVERVRREPLLFVRRGGGERRDRFLDLVALRVDVTGHVERVRDVGDETRIALVCVPRLFRRLAALVGVNQVVMRAELPVVFCDDLFEQRDGLERVLARRLARRFESVVDGEAEHRLGLEIVWIGRDELAQARDVGRIRGLPVPRRAARRLSFDVEPFTRSHLVAQRHRLRDRLARANLRIDRGARGRAGNRRIRAGLCRSRRSRAASTVRITKQLERRAVVAGRAERDAPVGHRHVLVELERLRAGALRLLEPEGVNLRHALKEELACIFR